MPTPSHRRAWFVIVSALVAAGCGDDRPDRVPVSGQVLIDGQPLTCGFVRVMPVNARPATGTIGPDGRFTLTSFGQQDGCVPGKHPAMVLAVESVGANAQRWHAPKEYGNVATSGLEVEITGPTDALRIELSWKGGQPFEEKFEAE